jgi:hypothetical protein
VNVAPEPCPVEDFYGKPHGWRFIRVRSGKCAKCADLEKAAAWRAAHPGHYRGTRAEREARARAQKSAPPPQSQAVGARRIEVMPAGGRRPVNYREPWLQMSGPEPRTGHSEAPQPFDPFAAAYAAVAARMPAVPASPAHRIGPEHRHPAGEFAGRVCYCGEPESLEPSGRG